MGTEEIDQSSLRFTQEWKRMLKYRINGPNRVDQDSQQLSSLPTPRMNPNNDLKKNSFGDLELFNETIPRINSPTNNILALDFKSSKEISDIHQEDILRYQHKNETLILENESLKKALQQVRGQSPVLPASPTKSYKKALTMSKNSSVQLSRPKEKRILISAATAKGVCLEFCRQDG